MTSGKIRSLPGFAGRDVGSASMRTDMILHPDHPLSEALTRARAEKQTFIPVADGVQIVGVFDVRRLAGFRRKSAHDRRRLAVRDRMTTTIPFLYERDPLALGAAIAGHAGIEHFCVIDSRHRLTGILSFHGRNAVAKPDADTEIDPDIVRRRLVEAPARAAADRPGDPGSYADTPFLRVSDAAGPSVASRAFRRTVR